MFIKGRVSVTALHLATHATARKVERPILTALLCSLYFVGSGLFCYGTIFIFVAFTSYSSQSFSLTYVLTRRRINKDHLFIHTMAT